MPQGSILGLLLFLVFINDVVDNIKPDVNLFADDTSLLNIIDQVMASYAMVNSDLVKLADWASQWLVTFNAKKTVSLHITSKKTKEQHPPLSLNGTPIVEVDSHCHLEVYLEILFTWLTHIQ